MSTKAQRIQQAQHERQRLLDKMAKLTFECDYEDFYNFENPDSETEILTFIRKYLITDEQWKRLYELRLSIEDCLNGRYGHAEEAGVHEIYKAWNAKLGYNSFGGGS
jgi:hypothetical protein